MNYLKGSSISDFVLDFLTPSPFQQVNWVHSYDKCQSIYQNIHDNVARLQVYELIRSWSEKCILTLYKFLWKKSWFYYRYILLSSKKLVCFSTPPIPLQPRPQHLFSIFIECQITWILKDPWILYPGIHFDQFINEPDIVLWVIVNNPNPKHINDS